jgi:hypothetical protein
MGDENGGGLRMSAQEFVYGYRRIDQIVVAHLARCSSSFCRRV